MKLKTKKRIAKEIIILLCGFLLALTIFLLVYPYNRICESKATNIEKIITSKHKQKDSLEKKLNNIKELYEILKNTRIFVDEKDFCEQLTKNSSEVFKVIMNDSETKDLFIDEEDFNNILGLKKMRVLYIYNKTIILRYEVGKLQVEQNEIKLKILSSDEQTDFGLKTFFIILLILYPLRFLYLLIIWSFKTIKQKEN